MAILNVTPDSFSDGGQFVGLDAAIRQAEKYVVEGADILDIGGESTRPGSRRVSIDEEIQRVVPVVEAIAKRLHIPISVDTTKSAVAQRAIEGGAEIINDISGLRFDPKIADIAAATGCGLVLMHSRGSFETMHREPAVEDVMTEVIRALTESVAVALKAGMVESQVALDVGIGFGKTVEQNLQLLANLDEIALEFKAYPILFGSSRKSFISKVVGNEPPGNRLPGSLATAAIAIWNGARIIRAHDVAETSGVARIVDATKNRVVAQTA
jgi:dihydropteroate synthase